MKTSVDLFFVYKSVFLFSCCRYIPLTVREFLWKKNLPGGFFTWQIIVGHDLFTFPYLLSNKLDEFIEHKIIFDMKRVGTTSLRVTSSGCNVFDLINWNEFIECQIRRSSSRAKSAIRANPTTLRCLLPLISPPRLPQPLAHYLSASF